MRAFVLSASALALGLTGSACDPVKGGGIGSNCSLDDPCDTGGVCNLSGPGDPVCIEADGDLDGDGLVNKSDFCNQKPGGQFDEDGDGVGDDCDACPIAPPSGQAETDGDGVDRPCDPDPTIAGNKIVLFEAFNAPLSASWRRDGGTWEARGGEAKYTSVDPNQRATLTIPLPLSSRHMAVQASYRIDRVDTTGTQNFAGVVSADLRPASMAVISCGGSRSGGADSLVIDSPAGTMSKPFTTLFDAAGLYRIAQLIENATGACAMNTSTQEGGVTASIPTEIPTEAGLAGKAVDARFQYLLIVQRP